MTTTQWTKTPNPIPRASLEYTSKSIPSWLNWLSRIPMAPTRKVNKPNTSMEIAYCYPIHGDTKKWGSSINGKDVMARGNVNYPFFHLCFKRIFFFSLLLSCRGYFLLILGSWGRKEWSSFPASMIWNCFPIDIV